MMDLYMSRHQIIPPIRSIVLKILQGEFLRINKNTLWAMFTRHEDGHFPFLKIFIDLEFEQIAGFCANRILCGITRT